MIKKKEYNFKVLVLSLFQLEDLGIAWGTVPIRDYAIGLATPDPSGGKIIDILGALDDIATADDAVHDVAESIENLLKDLGFIEE